MSTEGKRESKAGDIHNALGRLAIAVYSIKYLSDRISGNEEPKAVEEKIVAETPSIQDLLNGKIIGDLNGAIDLINETVNEIKEKLF